MNEENPTPQNINQDGTPTWKIVLIVLVVGLFLMGAFITLYSNLVVLKTISDLPNAISQIENITTHQNSVRECYMNDIVVDCSLVDNYNREHPPLT